MQKYSPQQIATILKCDSRIISAMPVQYLLTDSRRMINADQSLFFAINGNNHNGHDYIGNLLKAGVVNFVVQYVPDDSWTTMANFYIVDNALEALQRLAAYHRSKFDIPVVGITGSNGKTIVKEWLFQALLGQYKIIRTPRSYNSQIGLPLSVWNLEKGYNLALMEAGISLPGEMEKLRKVLKPTIGIFTNIGDAHQENFKNHLQKAMEKMVLFKDVQTLFYCADYPDIDKAILQGIDTNKTRLFSWSKQKEATLKVLDITKENGKSLINAIYLKNEVTVTIPFVDDGSVENAIFVWCVMLCFNISQKAIEDQLQQLSPVEMRLKQKKAINGCTVINDSYNSDMNSLTIALDFLSQQYQHNKKTLVLSDILQSGIPDEELYQKVADIVKSRKVDRFIGVGKKLVQYKYLFPDNAVFYHSTAEFIGSYASGYFSSEAILLKGARAFKFEEIEQLLVHQLHRTVLHINLDAIIHNLNYFRSLLKPKTKVMAMVKAISYGSGTFEIAHLLKFHRIDYLGVAYADEGIALRRAGVDTPIMVMNPEIEQMGQLMDYSLEPEIYSFRVLNAFLIEVVKCGEKHYPVHIKLDTGMHRLGFEENEIDDLIQILVENEYIKVKSVFTHMAASDDENFNFKMEDQVQLFKTSSDRIDNSLDYKIMRHMLNSSGIANYQHAQFDMVRLGIGLYGFAASSEGKLKNAFALKTVISQIKKVMPGETVGYNPKYILEKETKIATIGIGYADGYSRKLGNGLGKVLINGSLYPIIGNVCMDMCMVDITKGPDIKEGDEVIVFGDDYTANELAKQLGTIPYEIITSISERINRVYLKE